MKLLPCRSIKIGRSLWMSIHHPRLFNSFLLLILIGVGTVTKGQYSAEIYNLEMLQLKGPVKTITVKRVCDEAVNSFSNTDTSTCIEVLNFTPAGWMSYYCFYNKYGKVNKRIYAEYNSFHQLVDYATVQFGDTIHYQAVYDMLGFMLGSTLKSNGKIIEEYIYTPKDAGGKSKVEIYERGILRKNGYQLFNELGLLVKEEVNDILLNEKSTIKYSYNDSLLISIESEDYQYFYEYDEHKRLIYSKETTGDYIVTRRLVYNEWGDVVEMTAQESGKLTDRYVYEYNENRKLVSTKLYYAQDELFSICTGEYDEEGNLIKEVTIDYIGQPAEKKILTEYQFDNRGNWIKSTLSVTMMGMTVLTTSTERVIEYY